MTLFAVEYHLATIGTKHRTLSEPLKHQKQYKYKIWVAEGFCLLTYLMGELGDGFIPPTHHPPRPRPHPRKLDTRNRIHNIHGESIR